MSTFVYPLSVTQGKHCPVSYLDHVVFKRVTPEAKPNVQYYCPSTGLPLTAGRYNLALSNASSKVYPGTDHAPFLLTVGGSRFLYVSLDNSVRSNMNGHSLVSTGRLQTICEIVKRISPNAVFYSEACRMAFEGGMQEQRYPVYWTDMRDFITKETGMTFVNECTNNFDPSCMSFGVAMFAKDVTLFKSVLPFNLLEEDKEKGCYGSGAIVATLKTGVTVVGVHFPLDFARKGLDNNVGRAAGSLVTLLNKYETAYAMGDMNTVEGEMMNSVIIQLGSEWKITMDVPTFFPSYYDTCNIQGEVVELTPEMFAELIH